MARKSRGKKLTLPAALTAAVVALFLLLYNLGQAGMLPGFMQSAVNTANRSTGNLIYTSSAGNISEGLTVEVIDVGQADSIFIACEGKSMLIDGGNPEDAKKIENTLHNLNVSTLDYVVATHPHADHIGGLPTIIKDFNVKAVMMTDKKMTTTVYLNLLKAIGAKGLKITQPNLGGSYSLGGASFTVIAPNSKNYEDINDSSIVIRMTYKSRSFLFMGDASKASETDILQKGYTLQADVLKVGHHGSSTASTAAFLKAVSPKIALISVGKDNSYGLPDELVLNRLAKANIKIFRTDENGSIILHSDGNTISYSTEK